MALAGIDTLLIQASFSQRPAESRCVGPGLEDRGASSTTYRLGGLLCLSFPICKMEIITATLSWGLFSGWIP